MNAAEEEMNSSNNKEISTVDVNIETVSKSEDHPLSKNLAILKNSILTDLDQEFANEVDLMGKMPDPNLSYLDNNNHKINKAHDSIQKRRFNSVESNNKNDGLLFLEEPEDVFLIRNKASTLKCTVKNALNAWFECSSGDPDSLQTKQIGNYVDPQTGIRTIEIYIEVSKQNLEDHIKRINDIQTNYKFNNGQEIKAKNNRNRQYSKNNILDDQINDASDLVKSEQTAAVQSNLQLTKFLNNIRSSNDTTTISSISTSLNNTSISSTQLSSISSLIDLMKNNEIYRFQCWCKAFGQHKTVESRKASIELSFNGWSDWTEWGECIISSCGRGIQKRFRYCDNPPPIEKNLKCDGESIQTKECYVPCSNHYWSQWSQWSTCSTDCKQVRSRQCKVKETSGLLNSYSSSDGCQGQDVESKQCTGGLCRKIDRNSNSNKDHFGNLPIKDHSKDGLNKLIHKINLPSNLDTRNFNRNQLPILPNDNLYNQLPNIQPTLPSNTQQTSSSDQQQIFVLCSLLATSLFFLLLLILFILFKQRKRHFKNKNKTTILQLDKLNNEEQQQMLLLMQQNQAQSSLNRTNQPAQILISGNNRGYLQQPITNQPDLLRSNKMNLITRLNQTGTMDHLLIRNNDLQQSNRKISPLNTMNNVSNQLQIVHNFSNSNVSGSLTTASVNSNPSHNSDEEHQLNTPKYNRNKKSLDKTSPMFTNKINSKFTNSTDKYLINHQNRQDSSNYAYKFEEPDYAEPMLQSLQNSGEFEKFTPNKECKQSINSQSNSSNRSPSDISDNYYDNYDQFENEHYEQQYYECEQYENSNYPYKNEKHQFKEFIETDNLLDSRDQDDYDNLNQESNWLKPPLPKTLPPQRFSNFNATKHHTLNYSTDNNSNINVQSNSNKRSNCFNPNSNSNPYIRNSNRKNSYLNSSKQTNATNSNSTNNGTTNKYIEVS